MMKGIVLAGGTGSRLFPLTKITNKHLLPIYDKPMIYYPIQTLVDAGISDIMVVTGGKNSGDFLRLLANGKQFGLKHIAYTYQEGEGGIAEALGLCEHFADGQPICVVLGDNIIEKRHSRRGRRVSVAGSRRAHSTERGAGRRAVRRGRIVATVSSESRRSPRSRNRNFAVTGIYMYDPTVFDKIHTCKPSRRNELEITDVNNAYIREGTMTYSFLRRLVDGRRHLRLSAARRESGGANAADRGRAAYSRRGAKMTHAGALVEIPKCPHGIGDVILAPDSPKLIAGVKCAPFTVWPDDRGFFLEVQRAGLGLSAHFPKETTQISAALNYPGIIKAFHFHRHQTDCWTPAMNMIQIALVDLRPDSPTFGNRNTIYAGNLRPWQILIPPGVAHGYKVVGTGPSMLIYATDRFYDPADEGRIPHNEPQINYDWELQHK